MTQIFCRQPPPGSIGFDPMSVPLRFAVNKVSLGPGLILVLLIPPLSIIPPKHHLYLIFV